jgi:glycosyltransferase involved in cell wall biosynthesis
MKRIAFLTRHFTGATFPLAKEFLRKGYAVDYYIICEGTVDIDEAASVPPLRVSGRWDVININEWPELYKYFNSEYFRFYYYRRPRPYKRVPVIKNIVAARTLLRDKFFCNYLDKKQYECINLVGTNRSDDYVNYLKYLRTPIIISLHEVIPNLLKKANLQPSSFLKAVFSSFCEIVVHSKNSYEDIQLYKELNIRKLHMINFGKFDSFSSLRTDNAIIDNLPPEYILFYGRIVPYKGLDTLYNAVANHREFFNNHKIVVAGSGTVDCLSVVKDDDSFITINRFITNEELASLIAHSLFVVCPYRGISQSGIPQTTFVFNKPIVSSNLDAFKEVMIDGVDGLMFKAEDYDDLAAKMREMIMSYQVYENNLNEFEQNHPQYAWNNIAEEYITVIDSINNK